MSAIVAAHGPFDPKQGHRMLSRLKHRGPADQASHQTQSIWLGTCYSSSMTHGPGLQPKMQPTAGTWLIGDGRADNYRYVWNELSSGQFTTQTFHELLGAFAMVIADDDGGFYVARDSLGIAPLYWAQHDSTVVFASELKAFDDQWREAVEPFPPGYVWDSKAGLLPGPRIPATSPLLLRGRAPYELPPDWIFEAIRDTISRAVQRVVETTDSLGVLLSGGVDSSILTAVAARVAAQHDRQLPTFAVGMQGSGDLLAARTVAEHLNTDHHELVYTAQDAIELVPQVIDELESFDPTLVHSAVPHHLVSQLASQHVDVVLAGEGADELFAGYSHYGQHQNPTALHTELVETLQGMHVGGLQRVDRIAGAHGLEVRVPFLDLDVVELAMALPAKWKLITEQYPAKWLLRMAFDDWLPEEILWRRKAQFGEGTGMHETLGRHYSASVTEDELQQEADLLSPPIRTREELAYYRMFSKHFSGFNIPQVIGRFAEA